MRESLGALRLCDVVLRVVGVLVPAGNREEWRREWRAELWHESARLAGKGRADAPATMHLLGRALGALPDAVAMRRFHPAPAQEDVWSAVSVVARSPGAAGAAVMLVGIASAVDTVAVNVMSFTALAPGDMRPYLPFVRGLTATLLVLLPAAACIAAAVTVGWSDAARREEALRRAIGVPDGRLRRQRALEGVFIALLGCLGGAWVSSALLTRLEHMLADNGLDLAVARLQGAPGVLPVTMALALSMAAMLGVASGLWRKRVALD